MFPSRSAFLSAISARLTHWFANPGERSHYQAQVFLLTIACAFSASLLYSTIYFLLGDTVGALAIASMAVPSAIAMTVFRSSRDPRLGLQIVSAGIFTVVTFLVYHQGGMSAPTAPWLLIVPFALMTAGYPGPAAAWFVASCGAMGVISAWELSGLPLPVHQSSNPRLLYIVSQPGLCALVFTFLFMVDHARRKALSRLEVRNLELATARDEALRAVQVKSRFLANMSHEIRTPLNGVMGAAELLGTTGLSVEQRELVDTMKSSGVNLLALINDVLDFSKLEASRLALESDEFDLHAIVESVCDLLSARAGEKALEFTCDIEPGVARWVQGDALRLRQILTNLLGNAIKFTHAGEVGIEVTRGESTTATDVSIRFAVFDSGIGIAPEQIRTLFQAFVQADESTTRLYGGSGLGLAISNELARLMGGAIQVESVVGRGSRFTCTLSFGVAGRSETPQDGRPPELSITRVSLLEPHERSRRILLRQLQGAGIVVDPFPHPVDTAVLDIGSESALPASPVLIVSTAVLSDAAMANHLDRLCADGHVRQVVLLTLGPATTLPTLLPDTIRVIAVAKPVLRRRIIDALVRLELGTVGPPLPTSTRPEGRPSIRVLLVEDNPVNRRLALAMLDRLGCETVAACDGAEAVSTWQRGKFDLVLMDCQMPVLDGFEATRRIRELEADGVGGERTVIVALTANALSEDRQACLLAGMDDHLGKPYTLELLRGGIERWVGAGRGAGRSAA